MPQLDEIYRHRLGLLTDLYQLTMAYAFWKTGRADREAVFHLTFRRGPFGGHFAIACGLSYVVDFLESLQFDSDDVQYLATLSGADGRPLFESAFLEYLQQLRFGCDVDAVAEGTAVFPHQPLIRVRGPMLQAQIIETPLLAMINFQTLVATKAARICAEAAGDPVLEFGLRRAQGIDGALAASRAAYIGGCAATSNVLAGRLFGIPVRGTHAHSWVMSFEDELESFYAYADVMPNNSVFLVDTYDTLQGVRKAVEVAHHLRQGGHTLLGVRLDSGDLAELSKQARKILDEAGFPQAKIVASNDLDERLIRDLKQQGATINVWGVGTRLVTAYDQPALGGVYKLSALRDVTGGAWQHKLKLSEQPIKISTPGILQVRRFRDEQGFAGDVIYDELTMDAAAGRGMTSIDDDGRQRHYDGSLQADDLLVPVFRQGQRVLDLPSASGAREITLAQQSRLHPTVRRIHNPSPYPVGLERSLHHLKRRLIAEARSEAP